MQLWRRWVLLCFGIVFQTVNYAQNCSCELNVKKEKKQFNYFLDHQQFQLAQQQANRLRFHQNPSCQLIGNDFMITIFNYQQNLDSIKKYLDVEAEILTSHTCDHKARMEYFASLADYYMHANELEEGVKASLKALKLAEQLKETRLEAFLLSNLCVCFNRLNQYENELNYAVKLTRFLPLLDDPITQADYAGTIASSYFNFYLKTNKETSLFSSEKFANKSLQLAKQQAYYEAQVHAYTILSQIKDAKKDYLNAHLFLDSALVICETKPVYNAIYSLYQIYKEKTQLYSKTKQYKSALDWAELSYKQAILTKEETPLVNACYELATIYEKLGDSKNAVVYYQKYIELKAAFDEKQNKATINELEL